MCEAAKADAESVRELLAKQDELRAEYDEPDAELVSKLEAVPELRVAVDALLNDATRRLLWGELHELDAELIAELDTKRGQLRAEYDKLDAELIAEYDAKLAELEAEYGFPSFGEYETERGELKAEYDMADFDAEHRAEFDAALAVLIADFDARQDKQMAERDAKRDELIAEFDAKQDQLISERYTKQYKHSRSAGELWIEATVDTVCDFEGRIAVYQ